MSITGYYDGKAVRTDAKLNLNQRVLIIPISDGFPEDTAAGILKEYANTDLIPKENESWRKAAEEKYGKNDFS